MSMKNADSVFIYWNHCHRHTFSSRRLSIIQRIYYCRPSCSIYDFHDDDMTWKNLAYYWPFLRGNPTFHIAGPLWGESISGFPSLELVMWSFDVFFVISLNKLFTKQFSHLCFESMTLMWCHCNGSTHSLRHFLEWKHNTINRFFN